MPKRKSPGAVAAAGAQLATQPVTASNDATPAKAPKRVTSPPLEQPDGTPPGADVTPAQARRKSRARPATPADSTRQDVASALDAALPTKPTRGKATRARTTRVEVTQVQVSKDGRTTVQSVESAQTDVTVKAAAPKRQRTRKEVELPPPRPPFVRPSAPPGPLLLDMGNLVRAELLRRPSAKVKSPYVADVRLEDGSETMAHCPSLGCVGLVAPGKTVLMTPAPRGSKSQTSHAIQLVEVEGESGCGPSLVGAHPMLAEKIAAAALQQHALPEFGTNYEVSKQKSYGSCRVDFVLTYDNADTTLLEIKSVVGADVMAGAPEDGRCKTDRIPELQPYEDCYRRTALFPVGKRKSNVRVVSTRAIKHVEHLREINATVNEDGGLVRSAVLFVVNRSDCERMRPCQESCPLFASVLKRAQRDGVMVLAYESVWEGGECRLGRQLPVTYGPEVTDDVDEEWLARVKEADASGEVRLSPMPRHKKLARAAAAAEAIDEAAGNTADAERD